MKPTKEQAMKIAQDLARSELERTGGWKWE
jgi:hypothetical protein